MSQPKRTFWTPLTRQKNQEKSQEKVLTFLSARPSRGPGQAWAGSGLGLGWALGGAPQSQFVRFEGPSNPKEMALGYPVADTSQDCQVDMGGLNGLPQNCDF